MEELRGPAGADGKTQRSLRLNRVGSVETARAESGLAMRTEVSSKDGVSESMTS